MSLLPSAAQLPHPHLIVLRSLATLVLSAVIAQAGWAAAFLGGQGQFTSYHRWGAWVTLTVAVGSAVGYAVLRRSAGVVNLTLAILVALAVVAQVVLGRLGATSPHIFLGVLTAMLATALTSWTYRHALPSPDAPDGPDGPDSADPEDSSDSTIPRSQ